MTTLHKIFLENDTTTPMDFVVWTLMDIFGFSPDEAATIMEQAHTKGVAHVKTMLSGQAEELVDQAQLLVQASGYPLQFTILTIVDDDEPLHDT
jgi:ATP-dependent Clp protease adaptor protein ClpS